MSFYWLHLSPPNITGTADTFSANRIQLNVNTPSVVVDKGPIPEALIFVRFPKGKWMYRNTLLLLLRRDHATPHSVCYCARRSCRWTSDAIERLAGLCSVPERPFLQIQTLQKATGHHPSPVRDRPGAPGATTRGDDVQTTGKDDVWSHLSPILVHVTRSSTTSTEFKSYIKRMSSWFLHWICSVS